MKIPIYFGVIIYFGGFFMEKQTIKSIIGQLKEEMERYEYSKITIQRNISVWNNFIKYANENQTVYFSEDLGEKYLLEQYNYPSPPQGRLTCRVQTAVRAIRMLGDYQLHGCILKSSRRYTSTYPKQFTDLTNEYVQFIGQTLSAGTIKNRIIFTGHFLTFINKKERTLSDIDEIMISDFAASLAGYTNSTIGSTLANTRDFIQWLFNTKRIERDFSYAVPSIKRDYSHRLPCTWKEEEVNAIIASIDRSNGIGKRDYAVLILIAKLGLRRSDVEKLRFEEIDWNLSCISIVQTKTKRKLILPLLEDVGNAIIDYIQYGRPKLSEAETVFVQHVPPFLGSIHAGNIITRYIALSGVNVDNRKHGLHTLRHTLASRLLEKNISVYTISEILGHASIYSTNDYLHLDLDQLRRCALEIGEM